MDQTKICVCVPMYNCEKQIPRVVQQFEDVPNGLVSEIVIIDNGSTDGSVEAAKAALARMRRFPGKILINNENYGLGGSHKVAFDYSLANGMDYCIILHGDDQGNISDVLPLLEEGKHFEVDCLLGARFLPDSKLINYSWFRTFGNRVFNLIFSAAVGRRLYDLGAGLNIYSTAMFADRHYRRLPDDLTVNYVHMLFMSQMGLHYRFFPVTWREEDQLSNVRLFRQATKTLWTVTQFTLFRKSYVAANHGAHRPDYPYDYHLVYETS
jgi:glycosyltransferase involved in cell wall biosynthesis